MMTRERMAAVVLCLMTTFLHCLSARICHAQESSPRLNRPGSGNQAVALTIDGGHERILCTCLRVTIQALSCRW